MIGVCQYAQSSSGGSCNLDRTLCSCLGYPAIFLRTLFVSQPRHCVSALTTRVMPESNVSLMTFLKDLYSLLQVHNFTQVLGGVLYA